MKKNYCFLIATFALLSFSIASCGENKEQARASGDSTSSIKAFDTLYNENGYLLLSEKGRDKSGLFDESISSKEAIEEINAYQDQNTKGPYYVDFGFEKFFGELAKIKRPGGRITLRETDRLGLRTYFAKGSNDNITLVVSPTVNGNAAFRIVPDATKEEGYAFNHGSLCPTNCSGDQAGGKYY